MKKIEFIVKQGRLKNLTKFALLDVLDAYRDKKFPQYEIPIYVVKEYLLYNSEFYIKYLELSKSKVSSFSLSAGLLLPKVSPVLKGETPPSIRQAYQSDIVLRTKNIESTLTPNKITKLEKNNLDSENVFTFISSSFDPLVIPTSVTNLINSVRDIINNRESKKVSVFSQMLSLATTGKIEGKSSAKNLIPNESKIKDLITMMSAYRFIFSTVLGECVVRVGDNIDKSSIQKTEIENVTNVPSYIEEIISAFVSCIPSIRMDWGCAIIEALIYIFVEAKELRNVMKNRKTSSFEDSQRALSNAKFNVLTYKIPLTNGRGNLFEIFCSVDELPCLPPSLLLHPNFSQGFDQLAVAMIAAMITDEGVYLIYMLYNYMYMYYYNFSHIVAVISSYITEIRISSACNFPDICYMVWSG
jgi:hypothetical protein